MSDRLDRAVRQALDWAPCSDRKLAEGAGLSPALLSMLRSGQRHATPEAAAAIAQALRRWSDRTTAAADELERQLREEP